MGYIRKIKGSFVRVDSTEYVGEESYLFYDIETGCIRRCDGTPGGSIIAAGCFGGSGGSGGVETYPTVADFPATGQEDVIYIAENTNLIYRWDDPNYVLLSAGGAGGADNVDEYINTAAFPPSGVTDVIYIDASYDTLYRWDSVSTAYKQVGTGHDQVVKTIPAGTNTILYLAPDDITKNITMKFIISANNPTTDEFNSSEVLVSYNPASGEIKWTQYAKIGDKILFRIDSQNEGSNISLRIDNQETDDLVVSASRVPTLFV